MIFSIIGLPEDSSQTFRKGAKNAPDMLRNIFPKLETHIDGIDLTKHFIEDLGNLAPAELASAQIKNFPIFLGGEHTVTEWAVDKLKPKNVVIFDAHPDCEQSQKHDGITRRLAEKGYNVFLVERGLRAVSKEEKEFLKTGKIKFLGPLDKEEAKKLQGSTYVSIDLDVLEPSVLPLVGNPEPDGMRIYEVLAYLKNIQNIIGIDFVEFTPLCRADCENEECKFCKLDSIYASITGKLIYQVLAILIKTNLNNSNSSE